MNTLIELYDERPLENVVGVEMFRPERVVYICPKDAGGSALQAKLKAYFDHRGLKPELVFLNASVFDTEAASAEGRRAVPGLRAGYYRRDGRGAVCRRFAVLGDFHSGLYLQLEA